MAYQLLFLILLGSFQLWGQEFNSVEIQKAIELYQNGDFEKSKELSNQLLNGKKPLLAKEKIQVYNNLGNIFADRGENTLSLSNYLNALKLSKTNSFLSEEGQVLKNIGAVYVSWKKFKEALNYYNQALAIGQKTNDAKLIADCYNNLGTVYEQTNELDKASRAYLQALDYYKNKNLDLDVAMVYSNLAIVYKLLKDYKKSIEYNAMALNFAKKGNDLWMSAAISNNIGNAYSEINEFAMAEKYCNESLKLSLEIKAIEITVMAYESLADLNERKGDFKQAFFYSKKMIAANNSFLNANQTAQFSALEVKFKTQEKELQNQKLIFDNAQIQRQNIFNISIALLIFLFVLLFVLSYFRIKKQRLLLQQQKEMNLAVLESESKERFRIARDLHDTVGQLLSVVKMNLSQSPENQSICDLVDQTITEVREISHNLIPEALNFGLQRALEELAENSQKKGTLAVLLDFNIEQKMLKLNQEKELMLFRIVQELIGNTIKHAQASTINISFALNEKTLLINFHENGIGFDVNLIKTSQGLGWKNTHARLNLLNGKINVVSQKNQGSKILITLPND